MSGVNPGPVGDTRQYGRPILYRVLKGGKKSGRGRACSSQFQVWQVWYHLHGAWREELLPNLRTWLRGWFHHRAGGFGPDTLIKSG